MASLDDSTDSLQNPSFSFRETHTENSLIPRSISVKVPSFSEFFDSNTPPRSRSSNIQSLPTSPFHSFEARNDDKPDCLTNFNTTCQCTHLVPDKSGSNVLSVWSNLVYTGSDSNVIRIWRLPGLKECGKIETKADRVVALEVVFNRVFAAYGDGKIRVWRRKWGGRAKHARLGTLPKIRSSVLSYISGKEKTNKHTAAVTSLAVNLQDGILYSSSLDGTIRVWRISEFDCVETIRAHTQPINAVVVSSEGLLYSASDDATIGVWRRCISLANRRIHVLIESLDAKNSPVKTLTLARGVHGGFLYAGCTDGYVHYWTTGWLSDGQMQYGGALQGHSHAVMCMASVADYLVSGSADSTCRLWAREEEGEHACIAVLTGHNGPIRCVAAFSGPIADDEEEDGCTVCTGSIDGTIKVWQVTRLCIGDAETLNISKLETQETLTDGC